MERLFGAVYAEDSTVDADTRARASVAGQLTQFVSQVWLEGKYQFVLNFLVLGLIYLTLVFLINRFWISIAIFGTVITVFAVANSFKVQLRNEPIIPADLTFVSGGNTRELVSFIPADKQPLFQQTVTSLVVFVAICVVLQLLDRRNGIIPCHWRPSRFVSVKNIAEVATPPVASRLSSAPRCCSPWSGTSA